MRSHEHTTWTSLIWAAVCAVCIGGYHLSYKLALASSAEPRALFAVALIVNCGMWLERFVIVVISLHRDYMPSIWRMYAPTRWDWMTLFGSIGLFLTLLYLFIRYLPMISIFEMRSLVAETEGERT